MLEVTLSPDSSSNISKVKASPTFLATLSQYPAFSVDLGNLA
jgi:hypothetical protein